MIAAAGARRLARGERDDAALGAFARAPVARALSRAEVRAPLERRGLRAHKTRGQNFLTDPRIADADRRGRAGRSRRRGDRDRPRPRRADARAGGARATRRRDRDRRRSGARAARRGRAARERRAACTPTRSTSISRRSPRDSGRRCASSRIFPTRSRRRCCAGSSICAGCSRAGWCWCSARSRRASSAKPGTRDYGSLAVLHALTVRIARVRDLPPNCFFPVPQVTSTLVRAIPLDPAPLAADELARGRAGGAGRLRERGARRSRMRCARDSIPRLRLEVLHGVLDRLGIEHRARAEQLAPAALLALARALRDAGRLSRPRADCCSSRAATSRCRSPSRSTRRGGGAALEYATNLSPGGICLHARARLAVGEGVAVAFALPDGGRRIEARGRVTWREDDDPAAQARFLETGVRFEVLDEADRERILRFVRELEPRPWRSRLELTQARAALTLPPGSRGIARCDLHRAPTEGRLGPLARSARRDEGRARLFANHRLDLLRQTETEVSRADLARSVVVPQRPAASLRDSNAPPASPAGAFFVSGPRTPALCAGSFVAAGRRRQPPCRRFRSLRPASSA